MTTFTEASSIIKNYKYSENSFLPHIITVPLSQEYGVTCKPCVKPGDTVKEGDLIASLDNESYIHSSVPGVVQEITTCVSPNGNKGYGIKIKTGGSFSFLGKKIEELKIDSFNKEELADIIEKNGIINTFEISKPESLGKEIKRNKKAQYLVVRLFDEDNYRYTDSLITKFYLKEIVKGANAAALAFNAQGIIFAINALSEKRKLIHTLEETGRGKNKYKEELNVPVSVPVCVVDMNIKRYPSGTRREMLSAYNRNYKKNIGFNASKYDIFTDASTMYEVYKAVYKNQPSISHPVYFNGNCLNVSCILDVRHGTTVQDIIQQLGGFIRKPGQIIINGMIVGNSVSSVDVPVTKYVKSITIMSRKKETDKHIYSCVNCGSCRLICPPKLSPDVLYNNATNFRILPETMQRTTLACTNCGLCNVVCPSRLPLCQTITVLKENRLLLEESQKENK